MVVLRWIWNAKPWVLWLELYGAAATFPVAKTPTIFASRKVCSSGRNIALKIVWRRVFATLENRRFSETNKYVYGHVLVWHNSWLTSFLDSLVFTLYSRSLESQYGQRPPSTPHAVAPWFLRLSVATPWSLRYGLEAQVYYLIVCYTAVATVITRHWYLVTHCAMCVAYVCGACVRRMCVARSATVRVTTEK